MQDKIGTGEVPIHDHQVINQVEARAAEVVRHVQTCVELIRMAFPLKPPSKSSLIPACRLSEVIERELSVKVAESCRAIDDELFDSFEAHSSHFDILQTSQDSEHKRNERQVAVHRIIIPLFYSLWRCYSVLDQVPTTELKKGTGRKPTPPPGMLSLQAYTDIAALLEFCTCTSIIPLLESNILNTAEQRARSLPKSIAGRLPRASLLWGTSVVSRSVMPEPISRSRELELTATIMGNLVLLDRFRPMLLPRHLADLHAALFQVENLSTTQSLGTASPVIRSKLLPSPDCTVDSILLARSYQTLLLHGTSTPVWLRAFVSSLLTDMARCDLGSLVHVFVACAPREHAGGGGASLRLARALLVVGSSGENSTPHFRAICQQIVQLLDGIGEKDAVTGLSIASMSVLQTVWALFNSLPLSMLQESLIENSATPPQIMRRLVALLSFVPPSANSDKFFRLILEVSATTGVNVLGMLLSQASTQSILHSAAKEDALRALRSLLVADTMMETKISTATGSLVSGVELLAVAFVHAIAASSSLDLAAVGRESSSSLTIETNDTSMLSPIDRETACVLEGIEQRAKTLVGEVLAPVLNQEAATEKTVDRSAVHSLSSNMLVHLLDSYLDSAHLRCDSNYTVFSSRAFRYVPLVTLPILCEACPMESLLYSQGAARIFELMAITFDCTAARLRRVGPESFSGQGAPSISPNENQSSALEAFISMLGPSPRRSTAEDLSSSHAHTVRADDETLFSICSVLLSVLIGILELGAVRRTAEEEDKLKSFPSKLLPLASNALDADDATSNGIRHAESPPELANMASHASALILARQAPVDVVDAQRDDSKTELPGRFTRIEHDLKSPEVPIRARAVVSLRHLASALEASSSASGILGASESTLLRVLSLSLEALNDPESYVYLAALQTIATLADAKPKEIIPAIGLAISAGELKTSETCTSIILSSEQRVKLAEALMFVIRRKAAVNEYLPLLLDVMVYVGKSDKFQVSHETSLLIQKTTHEYFLQGFAPQDEPHDMMRDEERWEEVDTRVKSGGPLFASEEGEVVRAARLAVVTELVAAAEPSVISQYCSLLVSCSIDSLRLGVSRPIRRAGAFLARELYATVVREQGQQMPRRSEQIPFTVAMVAAHEDWLAIALERCRSQEDLSDLGKERQRRGDPATDARCQEALSFRAEAEEGGILSSGRLINYSETVSASQPLLHMLQEPSRDKERCSSTVKRIIEDL